MKAILTPLFIAFFLVFASCEIEEKKQNSISQEKTLGNPIFTKFDTISTKVPRVFCSCKDTLYFNIKNEVYKSVFRENGTLDLVQKDLFNKELIMQAFNLVKKTYPNLNFKDIEGDDLPTSLQRSFKVEQFSSSGCNEVLFTLNFTVSAPYKEYKSASHNIPFNFILIMDFENRNIYDLKLIDQIKPVVPPVEFLFSINSFSEFYHYDSSYIFGRFKTLNSLKNLALKGDINDSLPNVINLSTYNLLDTEKTALSKDKIVPIHSNYAASFLNHKHSKSLTIGNQLFSKGKYLYTHDIKDGFATDFHKQGNDLFVVVGSPLGLYGDSLNKVYSIDVNTQTVQELDWLTNTIKLNSAYKIKSNQVHQMRMKNDTLFYFKSSIY